MSTAERGPAGPRGDRGPRGRTGTPFMTRGARYSTVFLFCLSFLLAGGSFWLASQEIAANDHAWCSTLTLLTAHRVPRPADPAANPSRETAYIYYTDFLDLRHRLGCG